ncbi:DUF4111 domain-containing protein [Dactylosporangium roseum]|uniref:DUF4111 domain-containing protein n=1 Tax=Dactylosporangium roseum TaxID=47989 RepID=A0ABY5YVK0_9ACTN|nr:DUF4111 domain-containing protein [Dactylosporangium roseum]UWZ33542.1 DUF4111 domain-containing protein [Dactylosporangium roseum]
MKAYLDAVVGTLRGLLGDRLVGVYPAGSLVPRTPYGTLLPVVVSSVAAQAGPGGDNAVLNACRALRCHALGSWASKPDAGAWALGHAPAHREVIAEALASHARDRAAGPRIDAPRARAFLDHVLGRISGS